jgi:hypothetical protein
MNRRERAAVALERHLAGRHWNGEALVGPDYGVRLNYRVGRFVKSYLRFLPWRDDLLYEQAQGYWILANSRLHERSGDRRHLEVVDRCAAGILRRQRPDGSWPYPNPAWRGRVATAEGTWAAIGLLEARRLTGNAEALAGAIRWHSFLEESIGFARANGGVAVNYFAGGGGAVPNNSAFVLRFLAGLARATGERRYLERSEDLMQFLSQAQRGTGELPYSTGQGGREHFQCIQYNAFQCLDLLSYAELAHDDSARELAGRLARFLVAKLRPDGRFPYACDAENPEVSYHQAAAAAALDEAASAGLWQGATSADLAFARLLPRQDEGGTFPHSIRDYGFLGDRRSYPRSQAMMLYHLLEARTPAAA